MYRRLWFAGVLVGLFLPTMALADQVTIAQTLGTSTFAITPYDSVSGTGACPLSTTPCETFTGSSAVTFEYLLANPYNASFANTPISAQLNWSAVSNTIASNPFPGALFETGFSGSFTITAGTVNLLSGSFTNATLYTSGFTAQFFDSGNSPNPVFNSDFLVFPANTTFAFSLSLTTSNTESLDGDNFLWCTNSSGGCPTNFASGVSTFSSSPPPTYTPEPAPMLLSGGAFLGIGFLALRRRKHCQAS